jgi:RNA polymerase sigma factor (sigma-70 family)
MAELYPHTTQHARLISTLTQTAFHRGWRQHPRRAPARAQRLSFSFGVREGLDVVIFSLPDAPAQGIHDLSQDSRRAPRHKPVRAPPWYSRLIRVCIRLGRSPDDAEDLVQEAYVRFLEYRRTREIRDEAALLSRIVSNLAINQYHRQRSVSVSAQEWLALEVDPAFIDAAPSAEQALVAHERLEHVVRILERVSQRTCQIFLAHRAGYSYEEIAAEFSISNRTVQKHIARATILLGLRKTPSRF